MYVNGLSLFIYDNRAYINGLALLLYVVESTNLSGFGLSESNEESTLTGTGSLNGNETSVSDSLSSIFAIGNLFGFGLSESTAAASFLSDDLPKIETCQEFFKFLRTWINKILNEDRGLSVQIIKSHQNAPALKAQHIVIDYSPRRTKTGRATKTDPAPAPENPGDMEEGLVYIIEDYSYVVELREENGCGDYLKYIVDSIETHDTQQLFFENKVSFLRSGDIQNVPRLDDTFWKKQAVVEIEIGLPTYLKDMGEGWIDEINYTATIGGLQNE
ncbi:MAG: hypothetical protein PVI88_00240 [Nitrosopumilaceae archaeon]|jgi:hypothetical protein